MQPAQQKSSSDEHVFLAGRPPLAEYLGFLSLITLEGQAADLRLLAEEWRKANDHILELEKKEAGLADNPPITIITPTAYPLIANVLADPMFQRSFAIVPTEIGLVELDRLVVFQKHINLSHVQRLKATLGSSPDDEAIFRFCLPFDHPTPEVRSMRIAQNAYAFVSPSEDFRFHEPVVLKPSQITGFSPQGPIVTVVGLMVGYGSNYLNAIHAENRLILNNGSHRAFALREIGIKFAPCVIQHVSRREEIEVVGSHDLQENPDRYLKGPRPPLLKDYFDPKLRKVVSIPRKLRQVRITFAKEELDVPAS
jgi:hypothetical protein